MARNPAIPVTAVTNTGIIIFHETPDIRTIPEKIATKTSAVPRSLCKARRIKTGIVKAIIQTINKKSKGIVRRQSLCFWVNCTIRRAKMRI